jgi:hypothetical protein
MLHAAEAARVIVTELGPSRRAWALAAAAGDLERAAFAADPDLRPVWSRRIP